jgi:ATP-dependent Clp protease ATP-binding subunit ClpA
MFERARFTEKAYRAIEIAQKAAGIVVREMSGTLDLRPVEPEHILFGLLLVDPRLLRQLSPTRESIVFDLSSSLDRFIPEHREYLLSITEPLLSRAATEVVGRAARESSGLGQQAIATEHLLLGLLESKRFALFGLLRVGRSPVSKLLMEHGLHIEEIRTQIKSGSITPQTTGISKGAILMGRTLREAYKAIGLLPER